MQEAPASAHFQISLSIKNTWKFNFRQSRRSNFQNFPAKHALGPPRAGLKIFLTTARLTHFLEEGGLIEKTILG